MLLAAAVTVTASCGSGDSSSTTDSVQPDATPDGTTSAGDAQPGSVDDVASTEASTDVVISLARIGGSPVGGALTFFLALDRGYHVDTIAVAALDGTMVPEGVVITAEGQVLVPEGPDTAILSERPEPDSVEIGEIGGQLEPQGFARSVPGTDLTAAEFEGHLSAFVYDENVTVVPDGPGPFDDFTPDDAEALLRFLQLYEAAKQGFSAEQLIEAVIFGDVLACDTTEVHDTVEGPGFVTTSCTIDGEGPALLDEPPTNDDASTTTETETASPPPDPSHVFIEGVHTADAQVDAPWLSATITVDISDGRAELVFENVQRLETVFGDTARCTYSNRTEYVGVDDDLTDGTIDPAEMVNTVALEESDFDGDCDDPRLVGFIENHRETVRQSEGQVLPGFIEVAADPDGAGVGDWGGFPFRFVEIAMPTTE